MSTEFMTDCAALYRKTLLEDVVPFWMKHSLDPSGAVNNCLDDQGTLLSKDRFIWSQGRALWTFSAPYNRIERRLEWLDVARGLHGYLQTHGRDADGRWMYLLDVAGNVPEADTSVYVDAFVMSGLGEYYAATGDQEAAGLAAQTFESIHHRSTRKGPIPPA